LVEKLGQKRSYL